MVPVHVRQEDVGDVVRLEAERRDCVGRLDVVRDRELLEVLIAVEAGVDERHASVDALQHPDRHRDVETARAIGAGDQARDRKVRDRREPHRVHLVLVGFRAAETPDRDASASSAQSCSSSLSRRIQPSAHHALQLPASRARVAALCRPSSSAAPLRNSTSRAPCRAPGARGRTSRSSASVAVWPARSTTQALTTSPFTAIGHAGDADFGDRRMVGQHFLDLARPHLEAARLDQILLAIDDEEVAVVVEVAEVAGVQPAPRAAGRRRDRAGRVRVSSGRFQKPIISCGAAIAISPTSFGGITRVPSSPSKMRTCDVGQRHADRSDLVRRPAPG